MRPIRRPNGEDPWNSLDPATLVFKRGGDTRQSSNPTWHRSTYGEFRRKFGIKWANAWLWRTNCPSDPERIDMISARISNYSDLAQNQDWTVTGLYGEYGSSDR